MHKLSIRTLASALAVIALGGQAAFAADQKPEVTIKEGRNGVAPLVVLPLRNGGKVEFMGPELHPQVPPSFSGSLTVTIPWPEGKKK